MLSDAFIDNIPQYELDEYDFDYIQVAVFHEDNKMNIEKFLYFYGVERDWVFIKNENVLTLSIRYNLQLTCGKR